MWGWWWVGCVPVDNGNGAPCINGLQEFTPYTLTLTIIVSHGGRAHTVVYYRSLPNTLDLERLNQVISFKLKYLNECFISH